MTYLLALDQGTSSSRSIVFDAAGRIVAVAQKELTQIYPQPGWVEHDPHGRQYCSFIFVLARY